MEKIIDPISRELIEKELIDKYLLRSTNYSNNLIFDVDIHSAPNTVMELGRLRELTFREAGGGTGKEVDIDEYDTSEKPFRQLIVWDPAEREIVGAYRYIHGKNMSFDSNGQPLSPTSHLFKFSEKFIAEYLPYTIELGRSFVQSKYQPSNNPRKGLYALDNIWDGLGALVVYNDDLKYFFGKMTMYNSYPTKARDMILYLLKKHFNDTEQLVYPHESKGILSDCSELKEFFVNDEFAKDFKILVKKVREFGVNVPSLINIYMGLAPTMKSFGTSANVDFGEVEETGIMITIKDIYDAKKERHISFQKR
ncbi:MAG: GNAT family N-acetyltransferase [Bacteroidales bacterium]|nr:GNAT family N-acetyltransferase [Bacteroidales bacterium]